MTEFTLTEYTDFRNLEFEYFKIKDENNQIKLNLNQLEYLYAQLSKDLIECRNFNQTLQDSKKVVNQELKSEATAVLKGIEKIEELFDEAQGLHFSSSRRSLEDKGLKGAVEKLFFRAKDMAENYLKIKSEFDCLLDEEEEKEKNWDQKERHFSEEIAELQLDLQNLEKLQQELQIENEKNMKKNEELTAQMKSYKAIAIQARNERISVQTEPTETSFHEDDKDFATDLLSYEKEQLEKIFVLVTESFQNSDIENYLKKIYESYQEVSECFREKLQIEYDLSDIECQYQKLKTTESKDYLIELRKEISTFRKELFSQKEILHEKENFLQERIRDLSGEAVHDQRLKKFAVNLQSKLRKQNENLDSNGNDDFGNERIGSIEFRHTMKDDEMVKQMIQKDRENLERMLQETKKQFRQS